ncbi:MAG: OsmC family protein [Rhodospirillaceae bacterium]|nr:OsmC family protein [Rhodospirillaceae bacterium]
MTNVNKPNNAPQSSPGTVVVSETGEGRFSQWVSIGGKHIIRSDEPEKVGGDDSGGSPYDLLLAGLGSCTSMTLRMYADRKKWPLENVVVTLSHEKSYAEDCVDCKNKSAKIDHIHRNIKIIGDLSDEQRKRLLEIADMCPVHRTLHSDIRVTTQEEVG